MLLFFVCSRYHLQAFRHLYILAAEPRILLPRDVATGQLCYIPLRISFKVRELFYEYLITNQAHSVFDV